MLDRRALWQVGIEGCWENLEASVCLDMLSRHLSHVSQVWNITLARFPSSTLTYQLGVLWRLCLGSHITDISSVLISCYIYNVLSLEKMSCSGHLALTVFPLLPCSQNSVCRSCVLDVQQCLGTPQSVSSSLHLGQLWLSLMVSICCKRHFFTEAWEQHLPKESQ